MLQKILSFVSVLSFLGCSHVGEQDKKNMVEQLNKHHNGKFKIEKASFSYPQQNWDVIVKEEGGRNLTFMAHFSQNFKLRSSSYEMTLWKNQASTLFDSILVGHFGVVKEFKCNVTRELHSADDPKNILDFGDAVFIEKYHPTIKLEFSLFHDNPESDSLFFQPLVSMSNELKNSGYERVIFDVLIFKKDFEHKIETLDVGETYKSKTQNITGNICFSMNESSSDVTLKKILSISEFDSPMNFRGKIKRL